MHVICEIFFFLEFLMNIMNNWFGAKLSINLIWHLGKYSFIAKTCKASLQEALKS